MDRVSQQPTEADRAYRKVLWRLMPFLICCYIAAYIDRSNIGLARLGFMHDLGFNEAVYGTAGGLFYLAYSLSGVPSNLMIAKWGARRSLLLIMMAWGIFSAAMAFMQTPLHFYAARILIGAAEAGFLPGVLLFLRRWAPESRRARFNALFLAAIPISGVIGGPLGGWIMTGFDGAQGMAGWRWLFLVEGIPSCILGLAAFLYLSERPREARWLSPQAREAIEADIERQTPARALTKTGLGAALSDPRFFALIPMSVSAIAGSAAIGLWLPTIIKQAGVKEVGTVGLLSAIPYAVAMIAQYLTARRSDRHGERRWHSAVPIAIAGAAWLLLPRVQHDATAALVLMSVIAAGTFAITGPFWTMPARTLPPTAAAAGIAAVSICGGLGAFVSPLIVGRLADKAHAIGAGAIYYGVLLLVSAAILVLGTRRETAPSDPG